MVVFFFFQAKDGIRDRLVTGVQTCALPTCDGLIVSPADGVIQSVGLAMPPEELGMGDTPRQRISVFMNVFNVHVNRIPIDGEIGRASCRERV